ncbi:hypothetical protein JW921_07700 [Candidatus Fermentibacterales bacterium]|nr:hypothetical protein [Candidatus Fermentibacterales bacterium]
MTPKSLLRLLVMPAAMCLCPGSAWAQPRYEDPGPYAFGYRVEDIPGVYETMTDSRFYYPDSSGELPGSAVPCPVIVLGHGFFMGIDRYYSYAEHLASWGYIVALPTFSNPIVVPEHYTRARCMVDAAEYAVELGETPGDLFRDCVDPWSWGFTGHSMGGGCAFLAADTFDLGGALDVVVNFCSPQTTPPVHPGKLDLPKLVLCGSVDTIAPWEGVREAMWAGTVAPGAFAVILGANHGYCMDYSYSWENGGDATITREEQQRIIRLYLTAYMERYLHGDTSGWNYSFCYGDSILESPCMDSVEVLLETGVSDPGSGPVQPGMTAAITGIAPNPWGSFVTIEVTMSEPLKASLRVLDLAGRTLRVLHDGPLPVPSGTFVWDGRTGRGDQAPAGVYLCVLEVEGSTDARLLLRKP